MSRRELEDKVRALAERGATEGERSAAQNILNHLAQKYGPPVEELVSEASKREPRSTRPRYKYKLVPNGSEWVWRWVYTS